MDLESYLDAKKDKTKLIKALAYSLCLPTYHRQAKPWVVVRSHFRDWSNVALVPDKHSYICVKYNDQALIQFHLRDPLIIELKWVSDNPNYIYDIQELLYTAHRN